ncbi:MAG TPA: PAS domain S-box protein [Candidatus Caenarcaniphilales bacterium]
MPPEKANILMVDDHPENLLALEAILDGLGENLVKAYSGEEALKCCLSQDFAVILLDVMMPGLDGFETAALIRKRPRSRYTPVIFLTAFSKSDAYMFKGYSLGAVDYLLKPVEPEVLLSKIVVFVELFKKTREVKQKAIQLSESEARFQAFMNNTPTVAFMKTAEDGRYVYVNRPFEQMFGTKFSEIQGKTDFDLWSYDAAQQLRQNDQKALQSSDPLEFVEKVPTPDGQLRCWLVFKFAIQNGLSYVGGVAVDITERTQVEETLRLRDRAMAASSDCIVITGPSEQDNQVVYANPAYCNLTGYSLEEVIGRNCRYLQGPDTDQEVVAEIRSCLQLNQSCQVTLLNYRKDGTHFWNELSITPTRGSDGKVISFIGVMRDVTQRMADEEAMRTLTHKLGQSNRELSEFARVASHDLQEPLRKIQAFSSRIQGKNWVQPEGQIYLERMQDAAKRMSTLIQDLLAFSQVTTTAQPFVPVDLNKLAQEVVSDLEIRIEEVKGKVELGALPTIEADPLQMRQLLQNLIGNALKFQRPGVPPVVGVRGQCSPQACEFMIEDNGIGFDEKYKERIFNVFERLHGRSDYEGTGVGLAICRKIVERHGGTITASSVPGQGSIFTITLPSLLSH